METTTFTEKIFIGREGELNQILSLITNPKNQFWGVNIYGERGVGKTQLLLKLIDEVKVINPDHIVSSEPIDLYWTINHQKTGVLNSIALSIGSHYFENFINFFNGFIIPDLKDSDIEKLEQKFYEDVARLNNKFIVLIFDTYEAIQGTSLDKFIQKLIYEMKRMLPSFIVIFAGIEKLNISYGDLGGKISFMHIQGAKSLDDIAVFFEAHKVFEFFTTEQLEKIFHLTDGRYIYLSLFVDWLKWVDVESNLNNLLTKDKNGFLKELIRQYTDLTHPFDEVNMIICYIVILHRRFDAHILQFIQEIPSLELAYEKLLGLKNLSFIKFRQSNDDQQNISCLLHDEMRDLFNKIGWGMISLSDSPPRIIEITRAKIINWYDKGIKHEKVNIPKSVLELEQLEYLYELDINIGFERSTNLHRENQNSSFRASLLRIEDRYLSHFKPEFLLRHLERVARLLYDENRPADAIVINKKIIAHQLCPPDFRLGSVARLVELYAEVGDIANAILLGNNQLQDLGLDTRNFRSIEGIFPERQGKNLGLLLNNLGLAYRKNGQFREALYFYQESIDVYERHSGHGRLPELLNNFSYVLHFAGDDFSALSENDRAMNLAITKGDNITLGYIQNVKGIIYAGNLRYGDAAHFFEKALNTFLEAGHKRGRALTLIAQSKFEGRQLWERFRSNQGQIKSTLLYITLNKNFIEAEKILEEIKDLEYLAQALNEHGTLKRHALEFHDALDLYKQSLQISKQLRVKNWEADNNQDISLVNYYCGNIDNAISYANHALIIAKEITAPQVMARANRTLANILFDQKKYDLCFDKIRQSIEQITLIDPHSANSGPLKNKQFEEWLNWLAQLLMALPDLALVREKSSSLLAKINLSREFEQIIEKRIKNIIRDFNVLKFHKFG